MKTLLQLFILAILFISGCASAPAQTTGTTGTAPLPDVRIVTTSTAGAEVQNIVSSPVADDLSGLKISGWLYVGGPTADDPSVSGGKIYLSYFYRGGFNAETRILISKTDWTKMNNFDLSYGGKTADNNFESKESFSAGDGAVIGIRKAVAAFGRERELVAISKKGSSIIEVAFINKKEPADIVEKKSYVDSPSISEDKELLKKIVKAVWGE